MAVTRTARRLIGGGPWGWAGALIICGYLTVLVASVIVARSGTGDLVRRSPLLGPGLLLATVAGVPPAIRAATHGRLDSRTRWAWGLVAAGYCLMLAGNVFFAILPPHSSFPSTADLLRLAFAPLLLAGLLTFPRRSPARRDRYKLALDIGIVMAGGFMLMWYVAIGPTMSRHGVGTGTLAAALGYPITDLVLIFGATTVVLRGAALSARRPLIILALGLIALVIGDTYLGYQYSHPAWVGRHDWQYLCWLTGQSLLALAAVEQCRQAARHRLDTTAEPATRSVSHLPYLAICGGYGLLLTVAAGDRLYPWGGLVIGAVVMTGLVATRQIVALRENRQLTITDSLTGLANRGRLHDSLGRAMSRAERSGDTVAVLLLDLDDFKRVNDTLGHEAGDEVLVAFAHLLRQAAPEAEAVGRLGGDEFGVVLTGVDDDAAAQAVAARITAAMDRPLSIKGHLVHPRASLGIAVSGPTTPEVGDLLHHADVALYLAKRRRDSPWHLYAQSMEEERQQATALEADLRRAVRGGQLRLQYQPIVTLDRGELVGVEALVRWAHPQRGLLPPLVFIPLAEETGLIGELTAWVLEQACRQVGSWQRRLAPGQRLQLNVNLSPRQLGQPTLIDGVLDTLRRTGFDPGDLVLEVTETALVDSESGVPTLTALSEHGIRIALDDFGTGYSSLRYLAQLPVDVLKVDRCFVETLNGTVKGSAVTQAVIRLGQILRLDTVAEGIESQAQADELTLHGCRTGQGYHFARPLDPATLDLMIDEFGHRFPTLPAQESPHPVG
jgi:diguanylate cyclase (GGDEF)-like protein